MSTLKLTKPSDLIKIIDDKELIRLTEEIISKIENVLTKAEKGRSRYDVVINDVYPSEVYANVELVYKKEGWSKIVHTVTIERSLDGNRSTLFEMYL